MARFDKSSTKSPQQDAALAASRRAKKSTAPSIEDTMFFPRLRRHAKWMFVFLAVALGGGFVLFGVGAGGTGVGDILRGAGGSSGPSVSSAQKKTEENPKDLEAWRELSTAYQADNKTDEAIAAQKTVVVLAPKDTNALRELASLYLAQASAKQLEAQILQTRAAYEGAGQGFPGAFTSPNGQPILEDSISSLIKNQASTEDSGARPGCPGLVGRERERVQADRRDQPEDPNVRLELAQAAQQAGDAATTISAFEAFLKLAPDDPNAPIVKQQLKQLRASQSG